MTKRSGEGGNDGYGATDGRRRRRGVGGSTFAAGALFRTALAVGIGFGTASAAPGETGAPPRDCPEALRARIERIERISTPARWATLSGGTAYVIGQSTAAALGTFSAAGAATGGTAFAAAGGVFAYLALRRESLARTEAAIASALADRIEELAPVRRRLRRRFGLELEEREIAQRIRDALAADRICRRRRDGSYRPRGFAALVRAVAREDSRGGIGEDPAEL